MSLTPFTGEETKAGKGTCPSRQLASSRAVTGTLCQPTLCTEVAKPHLHASLLQVLDQTFPHDEPGGEGRGRSR